MDITAVTARLANEYSARKDFADQINDAHAIIETQEKRIRNLRNAQEFNEVQIGLLEVLIKRPDGVKIEAVKRPSFECGCPECNPQKAQEPIPTVDEPTPTKVAPAKKPVKRGKK